MCCKIYFVILGALYPLNGGYKTHRLLEGVILSYTLLKLRGLYFSTLYLGYFSEYGIDNQGS
jgi:hypothetical protein